MNTDQVKRERLDTLFAGDTPDRPPVAFWHHFYPEGSPPALARHTAEFYRHFDPDFAKLMPDLPYSLPNGSIKTSADWDYVTAVPLDRGPGRDWTMAAQKARQLLGPQAPFFVTMFSPLTWAQYWVGLENLGRIAQENPARIHRALLVTAESIAELLQALIAVGVDGIYYSVWGTDVLEESVYREFGRPYDLCALEGARHSPWNILHVHGGVGTRLDMFQAYPCAVVSWSPLDTQISVTDGTKQLRGKIPMTGVVERGSHLSGSMTDVAVVDQQLRSLKQSLGCKLIVAPGCSFPDDVSPQVLHHMRGAVDQWETC